MKKKLFLFVALVLCAFGSAFSEDYASLLKKGREYEAKKQYTSALGSYYDAVAAESDPAKNKEAYDAYKRLEDFVCDSLYDEWRKLDEFDYYDAIEAYLLDFERYWSENPPCSFRISDSYHTVSIDREKRTRTIAISVEGLYSKKFLRMANNRAVNRDNWPIRPLAAEKYDVKKGDFKSNGVPLFSTGSEYVGRDLTKDDIVAAALAGIYYNRENGRIYSSKRSVYLFEASFALVDENGKTLYPSVLVSFYFGDPYVIFKDLSQSTMSLINSDKAKIVPTGLFLKYGLTDLTEYYKSEASQLIFRDEGWHDVSVSDSEYLPEKYLKDLPEIRYDVSQAIWNAEDDVDVILNIENAEKAAKKAAQTEAERKEAEEKAKEAEEKALAARRAVKSLSTQELAILLGNTTVIDSALLKDCENLEYIGIPLGVTEIKANAFVNCKKLKGVIFQGTKKDWKAVSIDSTGNEVLSKAKLTFKKIYSDGAN